MSGNWVLCLFFIFINDSGSVEDYFRDYAKVCVPLELPDINTQSGWLSEGNISHTHTHTSPQQTVNEQQFHSTIELAHQGDGHIRKVFLHWSGWSLLNKRWCFILCKNSARTVWDCNDLTANKEMKWKNRANCSVFKDQIWAQGETWSSLSRWHGSTFCWTEGKCLMGMKHFLNLMPLLLI